MPVKIAHGTTTANTVATVTLTAGYPVVQVSNRGGGDLFVTVGGASAATPVVNGPDIEVVPNNDEVSLPVVANASWTPGSGSAAPTTTTISLISSAVVNYTVEGATS